jgi:4-hydroxythreonine-4-phosphate dehydrogenase
MLAFTCGDPAGVGPEIIERWLAAHPEQASQVAVIGPGDWLDILPPCGSMVSVDAEAPLHWEPGEPSEASARVAWAAMEESALGCLRGDYSGVVTGPVSKEWLARVGYPFPGQTEFYAARWGGDPTMAFSGGRLRVVLLSWHIPLRQVPSMLTPDAFRRSIEAAAELARAEGVKAPRIGICGLNPHAGEKGLLGMEEIDIIEPILASLRPQFPGISKCQPSDTIFGRQLRGEFDVVVALYHDQGLAPLKVIDFDSAVNITLGLAHVRTSPDHGTAFSIAGKGQASCSSFTNAVTMARLLIQARGRS